MKYSTVTSYSSYFIVSYFICLGATTGFLELEVATAAFTYKHQVIDV